MSNTMSIEEIKNLAREKNWELVNKDNEWGRDYVAKNDNIKIAIDSPIEIEEGPLNNIFIESEIVKKDTSSIEKYYNDENYIVADSEGIWKVSMNENISDGQVIEAIKQKADYITVKSKACICSQKSTIEEVEEAFQQVLDNYEKIKN